MGRKPTVNLNLPPRVRARRKSSGKTYYYYDAGGKPRREIPLGSDLVEAVRKWVDLERQELPAGAPVVTFRYVAERYIKDVLITKAARTQTDNLKELGVLYEYFDNPPAPLDQIRPQHIKLYFTWRADRARAWYKAEGREVPGNPGHVRANREIALFSHIFNYARESGLTDAANPCAGVKKNKESGRDVYVEDEAFKAVWLAADEPTRDAMDLAYLSGQRPADTLKFDARDVRDGFLPIQQNKTGKKLRLAIVGELAAVIERIKRRKATLKVSSTCLVVDEQGRRLTYNALRQRFYKARAAAGVDPKQFQFRDLRAKAGTDKTEAAGDIRQAQRQLGHSSVAMTETYVRQRRGDKVDPTR